MVQISAFSDRAFTLVTLLSSGIYLPEVKSMIAVQHVIDLPLFISGLVATQFAPKMIESRLLWGVNTDATIPRGIIARSLGLAIRRHLLIIRFSLFP